MRHGKGDCWERFWSEERIPEDWIDRIRLWDDDRQKHLNDPRSMLRLAANPYLLTLMVAIFNDRQRLPQSRIELFREFVEDLLYRERIAKPENHYPKSHDGVVQTGLRQLAWRLQSRTGQLGEARTILPRSEAEQSMPLPDLEFAAACSLLDLTRDSVRFTHQLLQEFFTAQTLQERRAAGLNAADIWPAERW